MEREKTYPLRDGSAPKPPNYRRVVEALTDDELREEASLGRGDPEYQKAVAGELEHRCLSDAEAGDRLDEAIYRQTGRHPAS